MAKKPKNHTRNKTSKIGQKKSPLDIGDVPVNSRMLDESRNELIHKIESAKLELKSDIHELDSKILSLDSKILSLDSKISNLDSKISSVDSKVESLTSIVHKLSLTIEEQNARNKVVLDGLTGLFSRQDRIEVKLEEMDQTILPLKKSQPANI